LGLRVPPDYLRTTGFFPKNSATVTTFFRLRLAVSQTLAVRSLNFGSRGR